MIITPRTGSQQVATPIRYFYLLRTAWHGYTMIACLWQGISDRFGTAYMDDRSETETLLGMSPRMGRFEERMNKYYSPRTAEGINEVSKKSDAVATTVPTKSYGATNNPRLGERRASASTNDSDRIATEEELRNIGMSTMRTAPKLQRGGWCCAAVDYEIQPTT